jgi:hypothetical protein
MEVTQTTSKLIAELRETKPKRIGSNRKPYFRLHYQKNPQKYLASKQKHRAKKQALKPQKPRSLFQLHKQNLLLKLLVNYHSFVPVAPKLKHPTLKD